MTFAVCTPDDSALALASPQEIIVDTIFPNGSPLLHTPAPTAWRATKLSPLANLISKILAYLLVAYLIGGFLLLMRRMAERSRPEKVMFLMDGEVVDTRMWEVLVVAG